MGKIEADDVFEVMETEPRWIHCHPDAVEAVLGIFGWDREDVDIWQEFPAVHADGKYYCSIWRKA